MKAAYARAMDWLYLACIVVAGIGVVVMTLVIPYGVFMRYVLNSAVPWPEPASVLMMILFTFLGAAACYRAGVHIAVGLLTEQLAPAPKRAMSFLVDVLMAALSLFMVVYGTELVALTMNQVIAEFPFLPVGITYLPIPVGGAITLLFILEHAWIGPPPRESIVHREPTPVN
ncbi:MAG: TRAP transporter small permease [Alphaproteobacteria bacterium]|nr:TRAP transporter small permease [Alphaproteobacteria bacterium]